MSSVESIGLLSDEVGVRVEHSVDPVKQLAHDGNDRLQRLRASPDELLVEGPDVGLPLDGDEGGEPI